MCIIGGMKRNAKPFKNIYKKCIYFLYTILLDFLGGFAILITLIKYIYKEKLIMKKETKKLEKTKATICKEIADKKSLTASERISLERTSKEMLLKIQAWIS
jgi:hypothetical protein